MVHRLTLDGIPDWAGHAMVLAGSDTRVGLQAAPGKGPDQAGVPQVLLLLWIVTRWGALRCWPGATEARALVGSLVGLLIFHSLAVRAESIVALVAGKFVGRAAVVGCEPLLVVSTEILSL